MMEKRRFISLVIAVVSITLLFGCAMRSRETNPEEKVLITLEKTPCRGQCPVFYMEIFNTGKVIYYGERFVEKKGLYEKHIRRSRLNELIRTFKTANFFNFKDEYRDFTLDLPTVIITYREGKEVKCVRDCGIAPESIKELQQKLDLIANSKGWKELSDSISNN